MYWKRACALLLFSSATALISTAQTFTTLVNFDGTNGDAPAPFLVQAVNGNLYGAMGGGTYNLGTLFEITPGGTVTTLRSFHITNGSGPSGLIQATNGNLYGTTAAGGANYAGTIFEMTPSGALTSLYVFAQADGAVPNYGLIQAANGTIYGTTYQGGANNDGTIFQISPAGTVTTLHNFNRLIDGSSPNGLVQASDGNLFGMTSGGRYNFNGDCPDGCGTIFKITPSGVLTTLYNFDWIHGDSPRGSLVQAGNGDLYGTTLGGGIWDCSGGCGTIFKITLDGVLTTLHGFRNDSDGTAPEGLIRATDGSLYGTTFSGGANNVGTIFRITPGGVLTTLYSFEATNGIGPQPGGLVQGTDGNFYGTTYYGGTNQDGTVFSLSVGLGPFVEALPAAAKAGGGVLILGGNLTGTTSVTFNGTPATFSVVRPSEIVAYVPTGATTGKIEVITPSGTLVSNVGFVVQ